MPRLSFVKVVMLMVSLVLSSALAVSQSVEDDDGIEEDVDMKASFAQAFSKKMFNVDPKFRVGDVQESGFPGFYRVQIINGPLLYVDETGEYFFSGSLYQVKATGIVDLSEQAATKDRIKLLAELNPAEMIIFKPKPPVKTKAVISVFTDVDCYYCQKLHQEVPELNAMGVEVRYLAYPRAGVNSASYKKIATAWCSKNPQETLTKLKAKQRVEIIECETPVAKQFDLGRRMGVTGTPAILLQDGTLIPGYRPAKELAKQLGI